MTAFRQGLRKVVILRANVVIEYRSAESQYDRLPSLATDFDLAPSKVIVATGARRRALAAKVPVIFSVGVLFYELLCGRKAFEADSFAATMYKVLQERPAPLPAVGHDVAPVISAIVDRAIEKDREHRYQSMGDMLRDLEEVRAALPPASQIPDARRHRARPIGGARA